MLAKMFDGEFGEGFLGGGGERCGCVEKFLKGWRGGWI